MSKRRIAALAAVIVVPLATLLVVLLTVLPGGDEHSRPITETKPTVPRSERSKEQSSPEGSSPEEGKATIDERLGQRRPVPAPDVTVPIVDDGGATIPPSLNLGELHGTPIVLSLWSSWCTVCPPGTRVMQTEWERLKERGILLVGLDVQDTDEAARRFRSAYDLSYPTASDDSGDAARKLGAGGVPETFFISGKGEIVGHVVGTASIGQIEVGALAARSGKPFGTQGGGARLPLR
jgi:peroxiredoxin